VTPTERGRRLIAFRPIGDGGFAMPLSPEAFERIRKRLITAAKALDFETVDADGFWLPSDREAPVVYFEPGPRRLVGSQNDRVAELFVVQDERTDGSWTYSSHAITRPQTGESYDRSRTDLTAEELEGVFVAWLQTIWPQTEIPAPTTIHLPSVTPPTRRQTVSNDQAHQIRASLEGPLAAVEAELHAGRFPEPVEHDLRLLIQQLHHWSNMVEPTTQGFEHILAEITRRVIDNTTEPHRMRHRLIQLGADPTTAAAIDASVRDALNAVTSLGSDDDHVDGERLSELAQHVGRLDNQLQEVAARAPGNGELAAAIRKGAGTEAGGRAVAAAIQMVVHHWDRIRIGLAVAWKSITTIFLDGND
jgi:hypothetical protein